MVKVCLVEHLLDQRLISRPKKPKNPKYLPEYSELPT